LGWKAQTDLTAGLKLAYEDFLHAESRRD